MLCNRISPARPSFLNTYLLTSYTKLKSKHISYSTPLYRASTMTDKDPGYKDRPPYKIRSDAEFGETKWRGSCNCGQVTYKISRKTPLNAKYCHCRGCQVTHGTCTSFESKYFDKIYLLMWCRRPLPMVRHLP
jgi:hypothetical protein